MKFSAFCLAVLLPVFTISSRAAEGGASDPAQTVQTFYASHRKHNEGFDAKEVKAQKNWLTPQLYTQIMEVLKKPVPKGDEGYIESDLFTDAQDVALSFHVGKATVEKDVAKVEVTFVWATEKQHLTVILTQVDHAWRISDIDYGDHRSLTQELRNAAKS